MEMLDQIRQSIRVYVGDITKSDCDVIVNAANRYLTEGGGVCGAIFAAAGPDLQHELMEADTPLADGRVFITSGCDTKAKNIIHTVGPVYSNGHIGEISALSDCYVVSILRAVDIGSGSIVFPCISTGIYGYPKKRAAAIAASKIISILVHGKKFIPADFRIELCCYSEEDRVVYQSAIDSFVCFLNGEW